MIHRTENDTWVYMVLDEQYPIFKLSTFAPEASGDENLTSTAFIDFLRVVNASYTHFREHNYTSLMVDVSRNGGGLICLAYDLLASLIYEWHDYASNYSTTVYQPYDVRRSFYFDAEVPKISIVRLIITRYIRFLRRLAVRATRTTTAILPLAIITRTMLGSIRQSSTLVVEVR